MPNKIVPCPFCGKRVSRGTALASHIRSAHSQQYAAWRKQGTSPAASVSAVSPTADSNQTVEAEPSTQHIGGASSTLSARNLLAQAYEQLLARKQSIEEQLSRFDDLRKEMETINAQVDSLRSTVDLFGAGSSLGRAAETAPPAPAAEPAPVSKPATFAGNRTELIRELVQAAGAKGVTPKEIDQEFSARKIEKGRNLIYNVLSGLVNAGTLSRKDGRYALRASAREVTARSQQEPTAGSRPSGPPNTIR
jgi:hypothetical protein